MLGSAGSSGWQSQKQWVGSEFRIRSSFTCLAIQGVPFLNLLNLIPVCWHTCFHAPFQKFKTGSLVLFSRTHLSTPFGSLGPPGSTCVTSICSPWAPKACTPGCSRWLDIQSTCLCPFSTILGKTTGAGEQSYSGSNHTLLVRKGSGVSIKCQISRLPGQPCWLHA